MIHIWLDAFDLHAGAQLINQYLQILFDFLQKSGKCHVKLNSELISVLHVKLCAHLCRCLCPCLWKWMGEFSSCTLLYCNISIIMLMHTIFRCHACHIHPSPMCVPPCVCVCALVPVPVSVPECTYYVCVHHRSGDRRFWNRNTSGQMAKGKVLRFGCSCRKLLVRETVTLRAKYAMANIHTYTSEYIYAYIYIYIYHIYKYMYTYIYVYLSVHIHI